MSGGALEAEAVYSAFLERLEGGADVDIDGLCAEHAELADELRDLNARWFSLEGLASDLGDAPLRLELGERYRVEREIGRGGMGTVHAVWDAALRRTVAMKVGHGGRLAGSGSSAAARLVEEAQVAGQIDHPGVVPVYELGTDGSGRPFFTMKLLEEGRTLAEVFDAVREGRDGWTRERALDAVMRVCEAMALAHSRGVLHRDLKPANVMVGGFGETYVVDWGLAKVRGREELADPRLDRAAVASDRGDAPADSPLRTRDGTLLGTPAYMPPEQARGEELSPRSDVYSVGAILYHLLTGCVPFVGKGEKATASQIVVRLAEGPPEPVARLAPDAPPELVAICERAMARSPEHRYPDMVAMADDVRAFLEGRVVRAYRTGAWAELRKWTQRNRGFAAAVAVLFLLLVVALVVSLVLKRRADRNAELAQEQRQLAVTRRDEVLRLAAAQDLEDLVLEADGLWPLRPDLADELAGWIERARALVDELPVHVAKRDELRARAERLPDGGWRFPDSAPEERWWERQLTKLIAGLESFEQGLLSEESDAAGDLHGWSVPRRLAFVDQLERDFAPGGVHARAWDAVRDELDAAYPGLDLAPQLGLVPLGPDPDSGLWELGHLASGAVPERDAEGQLVLAEDTCIVFVLLPGGTFSMGAQRDDPALPNFDPQSDVDERPVSEVELSPFLLGKYELTQGQWLALTGTNPSSYQPPSGLARTLLHPVENVAWNTALETCRRFGLTLPSEAQWEYGARGGTDTPYWTGFERETLALANAANLADSAARRIGADWVAIDDWPELDDGWGAHAPVGSYAANAYGLHDVLGNLWEWCRDAYVGRLELEGRDPCHESQEDSRATRVYRGGAYVSPAVGLRVSDRDVHYPETAVNTLGLRPARALDRR